MLQEITMSFRRPASVLLTVIVLGASLTAARAEPAASDQEACTPDVFRLCSSAIPDEDAIVACLNGKAAELSPQCRAVIDPPRSKRKRRARHA